jgi:HEAT repeat protein
MLAVVFFAGSAAFAQSLEDNWNDYLHYTAIARLDLAKGYAQAIIDSGPDPVALLALSEQNPQGYQLLERAKENPHDPELAELSKKLWLIIEQGRFIRRTDPKIIVEEVKRLNRGDRGYRTAVKRLANAGEYSIPFMLDALADRARKPEWPNVILALPQIGRDSIRPLAAALQSDDVEVKAEIIKALGKIGYAHSLGYLKYVAEKDSSENLRVLAAESIQQINPAALSLGAAQLSYQTAEQYYYHADSLAPAEDVAFGNIWFWDDQARRLSREKVDRAYFYELMAMRECEWALKADEGFGPAIGLWLAAFLKAESSNVAMPNYFGEGHADALVYATTAGPEYLHQALDRAVRDRNTYVALGAIEALAVTAGEKSLFYRLGAVQPLVGALAFNDRAVRYSAAIAIAAAGPRQKFPESILVVQNLAEAIGPAGETEPGWTQELAASYALRAARVMLQLARSRNPAIDLSGAQGALINATKDERIEMRILAGKVLAHLDSPDAQRAITAMALHEGNPMEVRVSAFESLGLSAKLNANLLDNNSIDAIYALVRSSETPEQLRSAAAAAYGALNLPSQKVKNLILDQAKS